MVNGTLESTVTIDQVEEAGTIFVPSKNREIVAVLEPAPISAFAALPRFTVPKKSLVIDIETTGADPTESRIITIGYLDPSPEAVEPKFFLEPTEKETVQAFINFYEAGGYTEIIGYNVDFDFRFIFVECQKYRIQAPNFMKSDLYDLMQVERTGQPAFVSTVNKRNKLAEWSELLLGLEKTGTFEELIEAWEKGDLEFIIDHVLTDIVLTYGIWVLDQFVRANIDIALPPLAERTLTFEQESPARVVSGIPETDKEMRNCPNCLTEQSVIKGSSHNKCMIEFCPGLL